MALSNAEKQRRWRERNVIVLTSDADDIAEKLMEQEPDELREIVSKLRKVARRLADHLRNPGAVAERAVVKEFWEHLYAVPVNDAKLLGIDPPDAGHTGSACREVTYSVLLDRRHPEHQALIKRHRAFKRATAATERAMHAVEDTEDYAAARERHRVARERAAAEVLANT